MNRRLVSRTALLACCCLLSGCLTCSMWEARDRGELVTPPSDRHGRPPSKIDTRFTNNLVGLLLTPFTLCVDIVLFPVQIIGGYHPYGNNRY